PNARTSSDGAPAGVMPDRRPAPAPVASSSPGPRGPSTFSTGEIMGVHSRSWRRREEGHPRVWIATLLRREGESGVQTHFRTLLGWADAAGVPVGLVTAFDAPRSVIWPAHGIGRVVRPV